MEALQNTAQGLPGLHEIMHPPVSVPAGAPAREALGVLLENRVPGVPVVEDERLVGFISDRHLLQSAVPRYVSALRSLAFVPRGADGWVRRFARVADLPVRDLMSREVASVEWDRSPIAAAHLMLREGVSSVVVTRAGRVAGIVNRLDLYAYIEGLASEGDGSPRS